MHQKNKFWNHLYKITGKMRSVWRLYTLCVLPVIELKGIN